MTATTLLPLAQADALLDEIERQTGGECSAVAAAADSEAHDIVARAREAARRHVHDALAELRSEGARRLSQARAQADTDARRRAQQRAGEIVRRAWPLLMEALAARWRDPVARAAWIGGAGRQARERLRFSQWNVERPDEWSAEEQGTFCTSLNADVCNVTFIVDPALTAGIRIKTANLTLDATPEGLLADRADIAAQLLAELDSHE